MGFFPEIDITNEQAKLMARGMLTVAKVDGSVDIREQSLLQDFWDGDPGLLSELPVDELKGQGIGGTPVAPLFLKSCLLVALADRYFSENEKKLVKSYAAALDIPEDQQYALEQSVKEYLLRPLSRLANTEAVAKVAQQMKVAG